MVADGVSRPDATREGRPDAENERLIERALAGGGQMGALIREFDWASTPLGPFEGWPQSLRTALSILLASGYPMYIAWGPELVQFYNDAYRPILGTTKHPAALGQGTPECIREIWDIIGPMFGRVMEGGDATSYHDFMLPLDRYGFAEECYFDFSYSAVRDESGGVGGVFVTCSETTGRVIGERRLRTLRELGWGLGSARSEEDACARVAAILAENPADVPFALIYSVDPVTGVTRLAGRSGLDLPASVAPAVVALIAEVVRTGRGQELELEEPVVAGPWDDAVSRALVLPVRPRGEQPAGALVVAVSPRRLLDDEYRGFLDLVCAQAASGIASAHAYQVALDRAEALADLDRAKTVFFSDISHEFRTPLTLLLGPLEDLLREDAATGRLPAADRERLLIAHRNALRLLKLVNSLLDFSRIEAGRVDAAFEETDIGALSADIASVFRSAADRAGLALEVDVRPLPEPVFVDREMWEKVLLNLLSNAMKFTFDGGIRLSVGPSPDGVVVTVADTGVGIPAGEMERVFERFHRVRSTRARTVEGAGIGLALVRELVHLHGGTITVAGEEGRGSTFTIVLPYGREHLPAAQVEMGERRADGLRGSAAVIEETLRWLPPVEPSEPEATLVASVPVAVSALSGSADEAAAVAGGVAGALVLIVDDNRDMREYLTRLLAGTYRVRAVEDAAAALSAVESATPDLVVSDVMMPGVDGFELLRALRARPQTRHTPIIMLSARAGEEATLEGLEAGADDYLIKPFSAREVVVRVRASLQLARARSEAETSAGRYEAARAAHVRALDVLTAISRHVESAADLRGFFGSLTATVAGLVQSRRAAFWLLDPERHVLSVQPDCHGYDAADVETMRHRLCGADGDVVASVMGVVTDGIAAGWRAGDQLLGALAASDSMRPGGFTAEDGWVLEVAALAAGLVWQQHKAERALEELRRAESNMLHAQVDQAATLERLKADFLRLASHELRGPLAVVRGYIDIVRGGDYGAIPEPVQEVHSIIARKADEMNELVDQMLETARIDDERVILARSTVDLRDIVGSALERTRPLAGAAHVFDIRLPDAEVPVEVDRERLIVVTANLVSNAVKYSPAGGPVTVTCGADSRSGVASVTVTDTGIGIAAADFPRLFTRFGRIVNLDNGHIPGTGLGLYLAREIARMHGGDVTIASEPGVGTTATLVLPLAARTA